MYFITFSRKMGTNGSEIARRVAEHLGYSFYDTEAIENTAQEMGFLEDVKEIDEKVPSLFQRLFSQKPEVHLDRLNSIIYELASRGNAVLLGRGSHILLRAFKCALHIRVVASLEKRIQTLVGRGFQREAAIRAIHKSDHERGAFIKFSFGVDWENPELYDLVLNMDNLTVDLAFDTVLHIASSEEIKARSADAMRSLEMMGLARRAEAALIEAGLTHGPSVSVLEPGKIRLTGFVSEKLTKTKAEEILKGVKGIQSIDNQIQVAQTVAGYRYG
ncbi:MAG TPA: cytidylate kinase family protein [Thermodesulfobacteriota bacterium]|nr:cytidylate kinase family protein [Thermodesulfobacteriota bacterium]